jgi:hypothetical protein
MKAIDILKELKRCGEFYYRAIEIDLMTDNCISGDEFEKLINEAIEDHNESCKHQSTSHK